MTEAEKALLFAMRNTIDALLMGAGELAPPLPCPHYEREAAPDSTLGAPKWRCASATCKAPVE